MADLYESACRESIEDREGFWTRAAGLIDWFVPALKAWDDQRGWFPGGRLNTAYNCIDRHVAAGRGDALALVYDSPITDTVQRYTYAELQDEVGRVAAMLARLGVGKGDRVIIYMPMIPPTVFAMLACARLGAIHSVVFGGFAPLELAKRIDDAAPKALLSASCGIEGSRIISYKPMVDEALTLAHHQVDHVVLFQREQVSAALQVPRDIDWAALRTEIAGDPVPPCADLAADDPLYILYTSGRSPRRKNWQRP